MTQRPLLTLQGEQYLIRRLREHTKYTLDGGVTTTEERRERIREAIIEHGLSCVIIGRGKDGKPETWTSAFERLYREPLMRAEAA
jgi:hypothetical protein